MKYESIVQAVFAKAASCPEKLCIADKYGEYSYMQFKDLVRKFASFFISRNISANDRVIVEACQQAEFPAVEFALHIIGAVFVPVEAGCAASKIEATALRCSAALAVTNRKLEMQQIHSCTLSELQSFIPCSVFEPLIMPKSDTVSEILFSTGTTGKEKGIVLTHKNDVAVAENIMYGSRMAEDNIEIIPSPLNHSHGLRSFYANMLCGGTVVIHESILDMKGFFNSIEKYSVNSADLVPSALSMILKFSGDKLGEYKDRLRYIEFGSAAMMSADREKIMSLLPGVPLYNYYGSTESGRAAVFNFNAGIEKPGCIGKPTANTGIVIVDDDRKPIVSDISRSGLLASCGAMNMLCYWKDEEETARATDGRYVYSSDEAYIDADGDIILLGRRGDVINVGGKKVAPDEIENLAMQFPGIADCGCISIPDITTGQAPKLFVQLAEGAELNKREILKYLGEHLEPFKVPKQVEAIEKIPRTFNGKLLRRQLK